VNPTQLSLARYVGPVTVHPDGTAIVAAIRRIDLEVDDYSSQLWLVPTDGGPSRQLTHAWRDASPVYSPDGQWIAFIRSVRDDAGKVGKPQLWVMPTGGGEARKLTDHPLGAEAPAWSADSTRVAYLAREPEEGRYGSVEKTTPDKEPPRRITRMMYRVDGLGFMDGRPRQIWVAPLDGEPAQVTKDDVDHDVPAWSPTEDLLVFAASGHEDRGNDLRSDVWVCRPDGSDLRALTDGSMAVNQPVFTPDGTAVVFTGNTLGEDRRHGVAHNNSLWRVPLAGGGSTMLTDEEAHNVPSEIVVAADGVLFPNENRGAVEVLKVPFDGGTPSVVLDGGRRQVQSIAVADAPGGQVVAASFADGGTWGDILVRGSDGAERVLTDLSPGYRAEARVFDLEEVSAPAPDGYPVHGWLVRPEGEGPHPVLLMIHGGPFTQYGWQLFDEAQVYAGAGYAVLMSNPRGSSGYGLAHGRHIVGNVGELSTIDLMALLDSVLGDPSLDSSRVGVLGGSHGGYMTTWLAAHEGRRFKAACSERAVNAIDSFTGASDIGWFFADDLYGPDLDQQRLQSPLTHAGKIDIPMLIIHSEQDWRCPVEQAQRLYVALRRRGVPTEMLLFPGEGHELSRSGLPSHRLARFDAILDWFGRHV